MGFPDPEPAPEPKRSLTLTQFFAVLKLSCFWYGVILCNAIYLLIDTVTVMGLTAAMALSLPQQRLLPTRPPASLLGARVVSSVLVMQAINVLELGVGVGVGLGLGFLTLTLTLT